MQIRLVEIVRLGLILCVMQVAVQAQLPEKLYLRFNEGAGTTTADLAVPGLSSAATLQNGAGFNNNTSGGNFVSCLRTANTTSDPCRTNSTFIVTGDWTIEFLVIDTEPTNASNPPVRYLFGDPSSGLACFRDPGASNSTIQLVYPGMNTVPCTSAVAFATWRHVAFVHDSRARTVTPYVNGIARPAVDQNMSIDLVGTNPAGLRIGGNGATFATWQGRMDEFRVWDRALTNAEINAGMNSEVNAVNDDIAVSSIIDPITSISGCRQLTASEFVQFEITNTGMTTIPAGTMFNVDVTKNGTPQTGTPLVLTNTNALATGDKEILTFTTPVDLSSPPAFILGVDCQFVSIPVDANTSNNQNSRTLINGIAPVSAFPAVEDFSGSANDGTIVPPSGWNQDQSDSIGANADWIFTNQPSPTAGTGPVTDNTTGFAGGTGYYALLEDGGNHANVSLQTNCFDFTGLVNPAVKFFLFSDNANGAGGAGENFFSLDVIDTTSGGSISLVTDVQGAPIGHLGTGWTAQNIDLSAFIGQTCRIVFRGTSDGGGVNGDTHDIAIDDITVFDSIVGIGQVPRPGLAQMDINNSLSPGLNDITSGDNGPYTAFAQPGNLISFDFDGEPNQNILVLYGPKAPQIATFGSVGQLDIGGPLGTNGIPTLLQIFGDGANPSGFNPFFRTTPAGISNVFFTMPSYPPGVLTTFQSVFDSANGIGLAISNAVEIIVN